MKIDERGSAFLGKFLEIVQKKGKKTSSYQTLYDELTGLDLLSFSEVISYMKENLADHLQFDEEDKSFINRIMQYYKQEVGKLCQINGGL